MRLAHIRVRWFRNLGRVGLPLGPGLCVLYGDNAQGKTSLIEAIYVLSNLQSFRTRRLRDLISSEHAESRVEGDVEGRKGAVQLQVTLNPRGRIARLNGKLPENTSSYLSELHTVLFSPLDLELARGSQDLRRRYLDRATFLADPSHLARLRNYNRVLQQRNALLRSGGRDLEVWDERLAETGAAVHGARQETLERLAALIASIHGEISGGREGVEVTCEAPYAQGSNPADALRRLLGDARAGDLRLGHTTVGPHRDAVPVRLGSRPIERHGSQGQMRTVALSFKLALLQWGEMVLGDEPVFLLDDPGSELDGKRLAYLGHFLARWSGQVIVACTEKDGVPVPRTARCRYYRVHAGEVNEG